MYTIAKNVKIGKLKIVGYSHTKGDTRYYICKCDCGMEIVADYESLKAGKLLKCSMC